MFNTINIFINQRKALTSNFDASVEKQIEFLKQCKKPSNLIDRSYNQYICQEYLLQKSLIVSVLIDIIGLFTSVIYTIYLIFKNNKKYNSSVSTEAVFPYKGKYSNILPSEYEKKYNILEVKFGKSSSLSFRDLVFILEIVKQYPLQGYFILKNIYKIALYSDIFRKYKPKVIFCSSEYSFTSSILTEWCRRNNVLHINVMHGEKLYTIRDSWFEFDVCSVWDEYYIGLFRELEASDSQFEVNIPSALKMDLDASVHKKYSLKYFLIGTDERTLLKIKENLSELECQRICLRLHPRYSNEKLIREIFTSYDIEIPIEVTLKESFENTEYICSLYSTVLYQAYINGKKVCIDDISYGKDKLNDLKNLRYIMMSKEIYRLSALVTWS